MKNPKKLTGKVNLDIGCGREPQPGFLGMDKRKWPKVDIVHDIEKIPWPIESSTISVILMSHIIEHIRGDLHVDIMNECWRIAKPLGVLLMSTPYGGSFRWHQDPTHISSWNEATVEYFIKGTPLYEIYQPKPWKLTKRAWLIDGDIELALQKDGDGLKV